MTQPLIECRDVKFKHAVGDFGLQIPCFQLMPGDLVFVQGESGSGKSTFLNLLAGVLAPQSGYIKFMGKPLASLSASSCDQLRVDHMGFLFQQFNLLPYLNVYDNVTLPCQFSKLRKQRAVAEHGSLQAAARDLLAGLGLTGLVGQRADSLSVGQQQRVAAARALIGKPDVIVADEPTSALDQKNQAQLMSLLLDQARQQQAAVVFVSHDLSLASHFNRNLNMNDWHFEGAAL